MTTIKPVLGHYFIKWLHAGFYDSAAQLECHSCENFYTKEIISDLMHQRFVGGCVITDVNLPVGYTIWERNPRRKTIGILNLVVHENYRCQGLATQLLNCVTSKFRQSGFRKGKFRSVVFPVREKNIGAQRFLQKLGFLTSGVLRDYFQDHYFDRVEKEDAFCFYQTAAMTKDWKDENNIKQDSSISPCRASLR